MKNKYIFGWMIVGLMALFGCEDNRENFLPEPLVYMINNGEVEQKLYDIGVNHPYELNVFRGGYFDKEANIELYLNEVLIDKYNEENSTSMKLLPSAYYSIDKSTVLIPVSEKKGQFVITFEHELISKDEDSDNYVLPLSLKALGEVDVNETLSSALIFPKIQRAFIGFANKSIDIQIAASDPDIITIPVELETGFNNAWDIFFNTQVNWNLPFTGSALDESAFELAGSGMFIEGDNSAFINVTVQKAKVEAGTFSIPLELTETSMYNIDPEKNSCIVNLVNRLERIPHANWSLYYCNSQHKNSPAINMIDEDASTKWEGNYSNKDPLPFVIQFELDRVYEIGEFTLVRRTGTYNTDLRAGYFRVSMDGVNWTDATTFDFGSETSVGEVPFYCTPFVKGKFVEVTVTASNRSNSSGAPIASICLINAYGRPF